MVKNDRSLLQVNAYLFIALSPIWLFNAWLQWPNPISSNKGFFLLALFTAFNSLLTGGILLARSRRWKPMNYRRQIAATWGFAARVPLAQPHPLPNVGALPVPFTITLKPTWRKFLMTFCLITGPILAFDVFLYYIVLGESAQDFLPFIIAMTLFFICLLALCLLPQLLPQRIEIWPEGMVVRHPILSRLGSDWPYGKRIIRWNEARLFAVRDGKPGKPATHYELSSPVTVVQWARVRYNQSYSLYRPAIPFAEYDAQMEALIALISGITGLPLYDVR